MKRLAVFASGSGSNARAIFNYFSDHAEIKSVGLWTNRASAGAILHATDFGLPTVVFNKLELENGEVLKSLLDANVDYIALAGFLMKIPQELTSHFKNRIINIHPALLPKFGGKGMYGINIHKAVIDAKEIESGITIHLVNENYDEGEILFQKKLHIEDEWNAETLASEVLKLEHLNYSKQIENYILKH